MPQYSIQIIPRVFHFKKPAGTSRGVYTQRRSWLIQLSEAGMPGRQGWGECAPLPALSCDDLPHYDDVLRTLCDDFCARGQIDLSRWASYPSMLFGMETALLHLQCGTHALYDTPFARGQEGIVINGLIWMGSRSEMFAQIRQKLEAGFRCIKLKIGAIGFEEELGLLRYIRSQFTAADVQLRVDANGAFPAQQAMERLERLAELDLHSIEQPIRAGQWQEMARLTGQTPLPIALDEELIGANTPAERARLLDAIRPQYVVLKPSLHGGMCGCADWIAQASQRHIGWWVTSALESNIGLNAIAHWCAHCHPQGAQGLGTGALFTDNIDMPLQVRGDRLWYVAD